MEIVVGEDRRLSGRGVFGEGKRVEPIILLVRAVHTEISLQGLIGALREAVSTRVIGGRVSGLDVKTRGESFPEIRNED
jgi:hypothetical protein